MLAQLSHFRVLLSFLSYWQHNLKLSVQSLLDSWAELFSLPRFLCYFSLFRLSQFFLLHPPFPLLFFFPFLLEYNVHTIKCIYIRYAIQSALINATTYVTHIPIKIALPSSQIALWCPLQICSNCPEATDGNQFSFLSL